MNLPTVGYDAHWADVPAAGVVSSHRATTSSRHPGVVFRGNVRRQRNALAKCPRCDGYLLLVGEADSLDKPHSPHWESRGGVHVLVDCIGVEVRP